MALHSTSRPPVMSRQLRPSMCALRESSRHMPTIPAACALCCRPSPAVILPSLQLASDLRRPANARRRRRKGLLQPQALFTGIVQGVATVMSVASFPDFRQLTIQLPNAEGLQIGASVAINGCCLTATNVDPFKSSATFDVIQETLRVTNLGCLEMGSGVNFERSARLGDEIGGHNVSGHIHTIGTIVERELSARNLRLVFQVPQRWMKYILSKGFIAVDGISLTVGEVVDDTFCVYLIPETLRATTLGSKYEGSSVNIEIEAQTQTIVDTVEKFLSQQMQQPGANNSASPLPAVVLS